MEGKFCTNCGYRPPEGERFCRNCGQDLSVTPGCAPHQEVAFLSKKQYFKEGCSAEARKREKGIAILAIFCVIAQAVLAVWASVWLLVLKEALSRVPMFAGSDMQVFWFLSAFMLVFAALSCAFTVAGIKTKRTGFFCTALPFAVIALIVSCTVVFGKGTPARLALIAALALYIAIIVLRCKNSKEYRSYTKNPDPATRCP